MTNYAQHYEESKTIPAKPADLFAFADDHARFSSHMSESSWMMGGGRMNVSVDEGRGRKVGSHIKLDGTAFGMNVFLDVAVTRYEPPRLKIWETVGFPKLLVIGSYRMGIGISPENNKSLFRVFIDYNLPDKNAWLGQLFGKVYAKWCVRQMIKGAEQEFQK